MNPVVALFIVLGSVALLFGLGYLFYVRTISKGAINKEYVRLIKRRNLLLMKIEDECDMAVGSNDLFTNNIKSYIREFRKEENQ